MVHYKINLDILRGLGMGEGAFQTFCGIDVREAKDTNYRHIPNHCDEDCKKLVVDCPVCKGIYEVIAKHAVNEEWLRVGWGTPETPTNNPHREV